MRRKDSQEDRVMALLELVSWAEVGQRLWERKLSLSEEAEGSGPQEATSDDGWWPLARPRPGWAQCGVGREGERSSKDSEWLQGEAPHPRPGTDAVNEWSFLAPTLFVLLHTFKQGLLAVANGVKCEWNPLQAQPLQHPFCPVSYAFWQHVTDFFPDEFLFLLKYSLFTISC